MNDLDVVIPVYNEEIESVRRVLESLRRALAGRPGVTIYLVDDGSEESLGLGALDGGPGLVYLRHEKNRGYGAALKTGIRAGRAARIAILDADGSYEAEEIGRLADAAEAIDMAIGARTGPEVHESPARRSVKRVMNAYASFLTGSRIPDVNSGMRVFSRELALFCWPLLPERFSFTSTMTMGARMNGFSVRDLPINYRKRSGRSAFRPVKDTLLFVRTLFRLGLKFAPLRALGPFAALLALAGLLQAAASGYASAPAALLLLAGVQVLGAGLTAAAMARERPRKPPDPPQPSH